MNGSALSLGMDILLLIFLVFTMYHAMKLSRNLSAFKSHRREFEGLLKDLNGHIEQAYSAIDRLKNVSHTADSEMQAQIRDAQHLAEDLKLITQSGESLAGRLEKLATKSRKAQEQPPAYEETLKKTNQNDDDNIDEKLYRTLETTERSYDRELQDDHFQNDPPPSFFIKDRDLDDDVGASGVPDKPFKKQSHRKSAEPESFGSQAEKDLYDALQNRKRR